MTLIAAMIRDGEIALGGDSWLLGDDDGSGLTCHLGKVSRCGDLLVGVAGLSIACNIGISVLNSFQINKVADLEAFSLQWLEALEPVKHMLNLAKDDASVIIAGKLGLFEVLPGEVCRPTKRYLAVGCAYKLGMGVLGYCEKYEKELSAKECVRRALVIAERHNSDVRRPFKIKTISL